MGKTRTAPTIVDVARAAGVSHMTVSRVFNGSGPVAEATRERVLGAARQIGYRPNHVARSLAGARTRTIGLVMDGDLFFTDTVMGLGETASRFGYSVIYAWAGRDHALERAHIETLLQRRVDGLVLVSMSETRPQKHLAQLHRDGVRLVTVNRYGAEEAGFRRIFFDWRGGTRALTRKLMGHGHRFIAFVGGTPDHPKAAVREQIAGYRAALQESGTWVPEAEAFGGSDAEDGEALTEALFARCPAVTALVTVNDYTAAGALRALRRFGRRVPDDVAVIGWDDLDVARCTDPPLTSVRHQGTQAGELACRLLISEIDGTPEAQLTYRLPSSLVIRGSCGLPRDPEGQTQPLV